MRKINAFYVITLLVLLISCGSPKSGEQVSASVDTNNLSSAAETNPIFEDLQFSKCQDVTDTSQCLIITEDIAIEINPDDAWFAKSQKEHGEEAWTEIVADQQYYTSEAMQYLEKAKINTLFFKKPKKYYKFVKKDKSSTTIDNSKLTDKWGMILFCTLKDPVFTAPINVNADLISSYFGK